jgi:hypothetical protein
MATSTVNPTAAKTSNDKVAEYIASQQRLEAENEQLKAQVAALQAGSKTTITASCKKFGKGTVSVSGVGGRFPESFHPVQWNRMDEGTDRAFEYINDPKNHDVIRASAFAFEMAIKIMGVTKAPEDSTPKTDARLKYEAQWTKAYDLAMADKSMTPSNPKYVDPAKVAADWTAARVAKGRK